MPRQRKGNTASKAKAAAESPTQTETTNTIDTNSVRKGFKMPLTPEQSKSIYAKRRTKGLYAEKLVEFLGSGEAGINVREEWPTDFGWDEEKPEGERGKLASTLKQGFENVKSKSGAPEDSEAVDVMVEGEKVYLVNKVLAAELAGIEPEPVEA